MKILFFVLIEIRLIFTSKYHCFMALVEYKFLDTCFNLEYWTEIYNTYNDLIELARFTDGSVSSKVGTLNKLRVKAKKFDKQFILLIKANYPEDWRNVLRDFGF